MDFVFEIAFNQGCDWFDFQVPVVGVLEKAEILF